jgi:hypothetical protein
MGRKPFGLRLVHFSPGDGTRTRNRRIDSPIIARSNPQQHKQFAKPVDDGRTAGRTHVPGEGAVADAELAALVTAWPTLPDHIRAAIRALVGAEHLVTHGYNPNTGG